MPDFDHPGELISRLDGLNATVGYHDQDGRFYPTLSPRHESIGPSGIAEEVEGADQQTEHDIASIIAHAGQAASSLPEEYDFELVMALLNEILDELENYEGAATGEEEEFAVLAAARGNLDLQRFLEFKHEDA